MSPALEWTGVPDGTESFILIVDDPDALDTTLALDRDASRARVSDALRGHALNGTDCFGTHKC